MKICNENPDSKVTTPIGRPRGRPPLFGKAMTPAERARRYRERKRAGSPPRPRGRPPLFGKAMTNAERVRRCRERKRQPQERKSPMSGAEYTRRWRQRRWFRCFTAEELRRMVWQ